MSRMPPDKTRDASGWATAGLWLRGTIDLAGDIYRGTVDIVETRTAPSASVIAV